MNFSVSAYIAGKEDFKEGVPFSGCPFMAADKVKEWQRGWKVAEKENINRADEWVRVLKEGLKKV